MRLPTYVIHFPTVLTAIPVDLLGAVSALLNAWDIPSRFILHTLLIHHPQLVAPRRAALLYHQDGM